MQTDSALREAIVGAWTLGSYWSADLDGSDRQYPLGEDAVGLIVYASDGFMSVQIGATGRPPYADGGLHGGTEAERAAAAGGYLAYAGTYSIARGVVTHRPRTSLFPNWIGVDLPRRARLEGDTLALDILAPIVHDGRERTGTLTWHRAR